MERTPDEIQQIPAKYSLETWRMNLKYAGCGCACPVVNSNCATIFFSISMDERCTKSELGVYLQKCGYSPVAKGWTTENKSPSFDDFDRDPSMKFENANGDIYVHVTGSANPHYGYVMQIDTCDESVISFFEGLRGNFSVAVMRHEYVEEPLETDGSRRFFVRRTTGCVNQEHGQNERNSEGKRSPPDPSDPLKWSGISTLVELVDGDAGDKEADNVVGLALLSYRDGSWEPCVGPTFEYITCRRDFFAEKPVLVVALLYRCVEKWFLNNWTLIDKLSGKRFLKVTHAVNDVIDQDHSKSPDQPGKFITREGFFFRYVGFRAITYNGGLGGLMSQCRDQNGEGERAYGRITASGNALTDEVTGCHACDACYLVEKEPRTFRKCSRCSRAYYCSEACQKADWKNGHKLWCCKRRDDITAEFDAKLGIQAVV
jgi:hypothetical protein